MDETEPTVERRVVTPTARGTERVWAALGALSMRCKPIVPGPLSRTLNRQLWLHTCIAVGVPAVVVLLTRDPLWTLLALCGATVGVGGMIYGEMYRIIRQLEGAIDAIDREEYDVVVRERRPDEIDAVFRGVEGVAADLDRRITDATEARDRGRARTGTGPGARRGRRDDRDAVQPNAVGRRGGRPRCDGRTGRGLQRDARGVRIDALVDRGVRR
jgi:methyl-accepting chemotaxis protein